MSIFSAKSHETSLMPETKKRALEEDMQPNAGVNLSGAVTSNSELFVEDAEGNFPTTSTAQASPMALGICKYFATGRCDAGDSCRFIHQLRPDTNRSKIECVYFSKGSCREGVNCRFSHSTVSQRAVATRNETSDVPVCKFHGTLRGCKNSACPFRHVDESPVVKRVSAVSSATENEAAKMLERYSSVRIAEAKGQEASIRQR